MGTNNCTHFEGIQGFGTARINVAFDGLLNAAIGTYSLTLTGVTSLPAKTEVSQTFTITVSPLLSIISPDTMNVTSGVPANFTVVATGTPTPTLSVDGVDLGGMTFTDNRNGTATISGIDSNAINFIECFIGGSSGAGGVPCGIVATNAQGTYRQPFRVNVTQAPPAHIDCSLGCGTTFHAGAPNQVQLSSAGATTAVTWSFFNSGTTENPLYPWVSLRDNGDGTAVLSGTPPSGTTGTFELSIVAAAQYSVNPASHYTITVVDDALFTSGNSAAYDTNAAGSGTGGAAMALAAREMAVADAATGNSFTISANTGTISLGTLVPKGLSFASFGDTATISGIRRPVPAAVHPQVERRWRDSGDGCPAVILNVNEAPKITSAGAATMFVGMPGSFAVTTTGFPSVSKHPIPVRPSPLETPALETGCSSR